MKPPTNMKLHKGMVPRVVDSPYYYKAQGITPNNAPIAMGGPVKAASAKEALETVLELSMSWNITHLQSIAVYEVDEYGVISEDPSLVDSSPEVGGDRPLLLPPSMATSQDVRKPSASEVLAGASWCREIRTSDVFATVKLNEEYVHERNNRSGP